MSETNSANATRRPAELRVSLAVGALLALVAAATWLGSALAQQNEKPAGIYIWALYARGVLHGGIPLVMEKMNTPLYRDAVWEQFSEAE